MKRNYVPTETDRLTGANLRELRKRRGETLAETTDGSGFGRDRSTLAATERGERRLTEIEAAKLAAHFGVAVSQIIAQPKPEMSLQTSIRVLEALGDPLTEQQFLGNEPAPALFPLKPAVPEQGDDQETLRREVLALTRNGRGLVIDKDNPMHPDEYRLTVWLPYLETRYAAEHKAA